MNNILFVLLSVFFIYGCKKNSDAVDNRPDMTINYGQKLIAKWKVIAQTSDHSIDIDGDGVFSTDLYAQWELHDSCHYRAIWEFKGDNSGTTQWNTCHINNNTTDPAISWLFNWQLKDKGYLITLTITSTIPTTTMTSYQIKLLSMTDSTFIEQENADYYMIGNPAPISYVQTTTYKKI